ncbi:MAG TPA: type II toxin-antitoxin system VapC family toxin [Thermoanaerobaculia bacterium]|jgi:tRNA(fMet)-specific endonuclease VapC|nr:type II toxin-antitoxin system VapC family toxin [Thermoanaerobaculia bacterium]
MRVLLDTNAYSALVENQPEIGRQIRDAEEVLVSTIVLGELLFGFHNGSRYEQNRAVLEKFLREPRVRILTLTFTTAERFGEIFASLRRRGKPIPTNDIWIAAQAIESESDLLSSDAHFKFVENLSWVPLPPR